MDAAWLKSHFMQLPGMYVREEDFGCVSSFLIGFDTALDGQPLSGFRDFVARRFGIDSGALTWDGLITYQVAVTGGKPGPRSNEAEVQLLFELLRAFFEAKRP
jgi:hypothetical protein